MITESSISVADITSEIDRIFRESYPGGNVPANAVSVYQIAERNGISRFAARDWIARQVKAGAIESGKKLVRGHWVTHCWPAAKKAEKKR